MEDAASQIRALEHFVTGNRDLAELEALVSRFNIFEALGVVNSELRHSNFLAFLLNPKESHGLGTLMLKRFLQEALQGQENQGVTSLTPIEIDIGDFGASEVLTEVDSIDVLIHDPKNQIVVIIENKVNSDQHSDQLARYYKQTHKKYPGYKIFGIYLTRYTEPSGHPKYAAMSHAMVCDLVKEIMSLPRIMLDPGVNVALSQYTDMLGRHFMEDEKIANLCTKIYQHHKQAIDLIMEHLPNQRDEIAKKLRALISTQPGLTHDDGGTGYVRFASKAMDIPYFADGSGWTKSGRMLLFEFRNNPTSLQLVLVLGPGVSDKRSRIFEVAQKSGKLFSPGNTLYAKWSQIYKRVFLESSDYNLPTEELMQKIDSKWKAFLADDLPQIEIELLKHDWTAAISE
jgi:PD-(D/E)XK nuclease superfamily